MPARRRRRQAIGWAAGIVWAAALAHGILLMARYGTEPGTAAEPPPTWPASAPVPLDAEAPTALLFAHPHCVCTRATLRELERVVARTQARLAVTVLFYSDPALGPDWERSAAWDLAAALPNARVLPDPRGAVASIFGAATSGTAVVYAPDGRLLFHGGLTAARGHEGGNAGAEALAAIASRARPPVQCTAVYGCGLGAAPRGSP